MRISPKHSMLSRVGQYVSLPSRKHLLKKHSFFITYVVVTIFSILVNNFLIAIIFGVFPFVFLFQFSKKNFLIVFPLVVFMNAALLMAAAVLMSLLHLPVYVQTLLLANLVLTSIFRFVMRKKKYELLDIVEFDTVSTVAIYILFFVAFIARVYSVVGEQAPILHDPIAHAHWAKTISDTHAIRYFYSPGLHVLIFSSSKIFGISFAQSTLFVTNLLNASTVLIWGIVAFAVTKSRTFTLIVSILIFALPYPHGLYITGGKNSLIVALTFAPLVFLFLKMFIEEINFRNWLLLSLSLCSVLIIHYPAGGIVLAISGVFLVHSILKDLSNRKYIVSLLRYLAMFALIIIALSAGWFLNTNADRVKVASNQVSRQIKPDESTTQNKVSTRFRPRVALLNTYKEFKYSYDTFGFYFAPIALASLFVILLLGYRTFYFSIPIIFATVFSICVILDFIQLPMLNLIRLTGLLLAFPLLALSLSGAITLLWENSSKPKIYVFLGTLVFISLIFQNGISQFRDFDQSTKYVNMVDHTDVAAFNWVMANLGEQVEFLNDAQQQSKGDERIYPTTGASWMPVFTDIRVSMAFHDGYFSKQSTHKNYGLYLGLKDDFQKSFCILLKTGFDYYYHDLKTPYPAPVDIIEVVPKNSLKVVYENSGVQIYKLVDKTGECQ